MATKGLSFKHVEVSGGTKFILLDSEGSFSPVKVSNELSVVEKEISLDCMLIASLIRCRPRASPSSTDGA